jgi:hypothetical protein
LLRNERLLEGWLHNGRADGLSSVHDGLRWNERLLRNERLLSHHWLTCRVLSVGGRRRSSSRGSMNNSTILWLVDGLLCGLLLRLLRSDLLLLLLLCWLLWDERLLLLGGRLNVDMKCSTTAA